MLILARGIIIFTFGTCKYQVKNIVAAIIINYLISCTQQKFKSMKGKVKPTSIHSLGYLLFIIYWLFYWMFFYTHINLCMDTCFPVTICKQQTKWVHTYRILLQFAISIQQYIGNSLQYQAVKSTSFFLKAVWYSAAWPHHKLFGISCMFGHVPGL